MRSILFAVCLCAGGTALAQPGTGGTEPAQPPAELPPPQPPQPPKPPDPPKAVVTEEEPPRLAAPPEATMPTGFSLAVGLGYRFPTPLNTPNTTSVRVRLPSAITLEPTLVFASTSHTVDMGTPQTGEAREIGAGITVRFPVIRHKRTELEILGSFDIDNLSTDPDNMNVDDVTSITRTTLGYGVAVGLWITPHVQASLAATNALVAHTKTRQEQGFGTVQVTTDSTYGLIVDPAVTFMVHLYN